MGQGLTKKSCPKVDRTHIINTNGNRNTHTGSWKRKSFEENSQTIIGNKMVMRQTFWLLLVTLLTFAAGYFYLRTSEKKTSHWGGGVRMIRWNGHHKKKKKRGPKKKKKKKKGCSSVGKEFLQHKTLKSWSCKREILEKLKRVTQRCGGLEKFFQRKKIPSPPHAGLALSQRRQPIWT